MEKIGLKRREKLKYEIITLCINRNKRNEYLKFEEFNC